MAIFRERRNETETRVLFMIAGVYGIYIFFLVFGADDLIKGESCAISGAWAAVVF